MRRVALCLIAFVALASGPVFAEQDAAESPEIACESDTCSNVTDAQEREEPAELVCSGRWCTEAPEDETAESSTPVACSASDCRSETDH